MSAPVTSTSVETWKTDGDTSILHEGGRHHGLPPLDETAPPLSHFETWRPVVFYFPLFLQWAWLGLRYRGLTLPTVANPLFPVGGLIGESKAQILDTIQDPEARSLVAPYIVLPMPEGEDRTVLLNQALDRMNEEGLAFPVVAKPDIGCRGAGVRLTRSVEDLDAYLERFPRGDSVVLQELVPYEAEAGVFYIRRPSEPKGRIFSFTLKYFPYVTGDGSSTLRQLIEADPRAGRLAHLYLPRHSDHLDTVLPEGRTYRLAFAGSHSRGTIFKNGNAHITPEMTEVFDRVSKAIPEFYFGRFDVRFRSLDDLQRGEHFRIIEINGAGAEATHIWDSRTTLGEAYRDLAEQYRELYRIGFENRRRGFKPMPVLKLIARYWHEEQVTRHYPPTE